MNRCAIFLYYDRDGKVDDYVTYLLRALRPHVSNILAVINGTLTWESTECLKGVSDEMLFRENTGFDVGGYREGLFYYGFKELKQYDEIILLNYTFFGPLYPFSEMFDEMDARDLDFWGITRHYKVEPDPYGANRYGYMPEHIQSHFLVLRNRFFMSDDYKDFMFNLRNPTSYVESICEYETIFTKHFEDLGYRWDTYVNTDDYKGYAFCPIMFYLKDMIEKQRCPIVKRRSFFTDYQDYLLNTVGEPSIDAYEYICENLDYDTNLIWDNILRLENLTEIARVMHFNYILPTYASGQLKIDKKVAVFVVLESIQHKSQYRRYFQAIPGELKVYLVGRRQDCLEIQQEYLKDSLPHIIEMEGSYTERISHIMEEARDKYDYVCIANMRNVKNIEPYSNEISWQYSDWENILGSREMVLNIIETFEKNQRLGLLIPPMPEYGEMFAVMEDGWMGCYEKVKDSLERAGIVVKIKREDEALSPVGGSLWLRMRSNVAEAVETLKGDMKIFCLAIPFAVQSAGYYTGILYSDKYAAIEVTNQDYMMRETNKAIFETYGPTYHVLVLDRIRNEEVMGEAEGAEDSGTTSRKYKAFIKKTLKRYMPERFYLFGKKVYFMIRGRKIG